MLKLFTQYGNMFMAGQPPLQLDHAATNQVAERIVELEATVKQQQQIIAELTQQINEYRKRPREDDLLVKDDQSHKLLKTNDEHQHLLQTQLQ
eukprot:TRINITY_DN33130_c0_g1_i1.p2 TRINITY_DN33130_c0_g1~~TRINITY_DN33130_c0_g1_i1.p2  ORF type:complete len:93 (+),score=27.50 TRINITY_DN33130_c0_g1_i1:250-528(+)